MESVKEISVFVDESGSFDSLKESSRFYLICFVFHDQSSDINNLIGDLEGFLVDCGLANKHCVHVGPLIRHEDDYSKMERSQRQSIFRGMLAFTRKADISYKCFVVDKHFNTDDATLHDKLLQEMIGFLISRAEKLNSYSKLKLYYDNGQFQVRKVLEEAFALFSAITEFVPFVKPENYRLFQVADLVCSVELAAAKLEHGGKLSQSEQRFFGGERQFRRNILKQVRAKML